VRSARDRAALSRRRRLSSDLRYQVPDHAAIARFRARHERAIAGLFGGVLSCARVPLLLAAVWVFLLRDLPEVSVGVGGQDLGQRRLVRDFAPAAGTVLAFLLVFGLLGGWLLAGRMLAPLARITDATRTAATGSLAHRIRLPGRKDEFRELADAFDTMLARLEAHVAEQQRFAANASHELRTPLAITQTLLDVARNDQHRGNDELVDRLHAVNTRAIDLTEALLLLSRADQRSFAREHVDLSLIAEEATETLLPLAEDRGVTIETSGDVTPAIGSRAPAAVNDEPRAQRDRPQSA
jgi:two-component system, OmpR family, sensor histidine kinase VanS